MKTLQKTILLICLLILCHPARSGIGMNAAELRKFYGEPETTEKVAKNKVKYNYSDGGIQLIYNTTEDVVVRQENHIDGTHFEAVQTMLHHNYPKYEGGWYKYQVHETAGQILSKAENNTVIFALQSTITVPWWKEFTVVQWIILTISVLIIVGIVVLLGAGAQMLLLGMDIERDIQNSYKSKKQ